MTGEFKSLHLNEKSSKENPGAFLKTGAGEEIRTLDIDLGKVALYH